MLRIYNSLTRKIEEFRSLNGPEVGMYTCGPTVYDFAHIGNMRTYTTADLLVRTLKFLGFKPRYIMNITDVGHLTGDNLGDASTGEDRMEKASQKEGKSAWEIAKFYEKQFIEDYEKLNLIKPEKFTRATEYISEQIDLVKKLETKGFTYKTSDGVYFDTSKFPGYGKLSTLDEKGIDPGVRVEMRDKRNPRDFALWKFSDNASRRQMEWDSPWGMGFPGWHIECSAMSMKYLGESFDIHVGGEDLRSTHHPNEIAQSEAASGKQFVKYWVHGAFMNIDGERMAKSKGNLFTLTDIVKKGYSPGALRYLYMTAHYRQKMNFTFAALDACEAALKNLKSQMAGFKNNGSRKVLSGEKLEKADHYRAKFTRCIADDLNLSQAVAVVWEVVKSNIPQGDKYDLLELFDQVLGVGLGDVVEDEVPGEVVRLAQERQKLRDSGKFAEADGLREEVRKRGYEVADSEGKYKIVKTRTNR